MILKRLLQELGLGRAEVIAGNGEQLQVLRVAEFSAEQAESSGTLFLIPDLAALDAARPMLASTAANAVMLPGVLRPQLSPEMLDAAKATLVQLPGRIQLDLSAKIQRILDEEAANLSPDSSSRARQDLVEDFLFGRYQDLRALMTRARALGVRLERATTVLVVGFPGFERYYVQNEHKGEAHFQRLKSRIIDTVRREAMEAGVENVAVAHGEGAVVLTPRDPEPLGRTLAQSLRRELRFVPLAVAAGRVQVGPEGLARSYQEALLALHLRGRLRLQERYVAFGDLTGHALLHQLQSAPDIAALLEHEIAPLLEVEYGRKALLVETIAAFYDAGGSLKQAASTLKIHPKTLRYRLDRIEDVLGRGALDSDKRLLFHLAARYYLWRKS